MTLAAVRSGFGWQRRPLSRVVEDISTYRGNLSPVYARLAPHVAGIFPKCAFLL